MLLRLQEVVHRLAAAAAVERVRVGQERPAAGAPTHSARRRRSAAGRSRGFSPRRNAFDRAGAAFLDELREPAASASRTAFSACDSMLSPSATGVKKTFAFSIWSPSERNAPARSLTATPPRALTESSPYLMMLGKANIAAKRRNHDCGAGLSESLGDYLESIYHLARGRPAARVKDIAEQMEVQKSSVTGALKSLAEKALVNYEPYSSSRSRRAARRPPATWCAGTRR